MTKLQVPFFRPSLQEHEINEVVETLRSGWLTSGPKVQRFERDFGTAVGAANAVALNSCTAALHLAVEALGLKPGDGVLVPTMTFAATAEVVRYQGAIPILVDCDPQTLNLDLDDAARKIASWQAGKGAQRRNGQTATPARGTNGRPAKIVGIMPVHVGGLMMDLVGLEAFAKKNKLWIVEDAAHAFPAGWRRTANQAWQQRTNGSSAVTCYSFYANKTITTGEGGMAVTDNAKLAQRIKMMSLHGLSHDAWGRYSAKGNWDYKIVAPGYKYNLTDVAAALGIHQLARAEAMRLEREQIAGRYADAFATIAQIELPPDDASRIHAWHLFVLKLRLRQLTINRNEFINELKRAGVGCSVHWRPLHLHPYYQKTFGFRSKDFPVATASWKRVISLPIFPGMRDEEVEYVIATVRRICARYAR